MKKLLLFICLCLPVVLHAAETDYAAQIQEMKTETHPLLRSLSEKGVLHAYSSWAKKYIASNDYMQAAEIYQQAVQDTFLRADYQTVLAMELAALYNNRLLMHRSAQQVLEEHRFSDTYPDAWIWTYRMAQTRIYMHHI